MQYERDTGLVKRCIPVLLLGIVAFTVSVFQTPRVSAGTTTQAPAGTAAAVVDLGHVQISGRPTPSVFPAGALPPGARLLLPNERLSLEEAEQSVSFPIVLPTWLPSPTYELEWVQLLGDGVVVNYRDTSVQTLRDVSIQEQPWADLGGAFFIPAAPEASSIGDQPSAVWTQGEGTPVGILQHVAWERGSLFLLLTTSGGISADDTNQIAASVTEQP